MLTCRMHYEKKDVEIFIGEHYYRVDYGILRDTCLSCLTSELPPVRVFAKCPRVFALRIPNTNMSCAIDYLITLRRRDSDYPILLERKHYCTHPLNYVDRVSQEDLKILLDFIKENQNE